MNTESTAGRKRLRNVAKICVNYGQRVQNSVFECSVSPSELCVIKNELIKTIDIQKDSLRFYNLGNNYKSRIEHFGVKESYDPQEPMIY